MKLNWVYPFATLERLGNWFEVTLAMNSGTVTGDKEEKMANS